MGHQATLASAIVVVLMTGVVSAAVMTGTFSDKPAAPVGDTTLSAADGDVTTAGVLTGRNPGHSAPGQASARSGGASTGGTASSPARAACPSAACRALAIS